MNNGLLYLGGILVVVLAALFAVPNFIDWNGYRGVFEEEASKVLGRDVRVGGSVNLKLLPVPYVRFEKVRIANLTGQTGEPFVRAESFTMWLSGPSLLRGVFEASQIELNKPVLTLAVDDQGTGNWTNIELKPGDMPFVPRDVALRSVQVTDGAVAIYNAASERVASLDGIDGELSADGLKGPFRFKGSASWSGVEHDVKFATDVPGSDGAFALKLSARADRSSNVYMLDGRVYNLSSKPTFKGRWTGKLAVPGSETVAKGEAPLLDLKSDVTADALGAKFENVTLALDNAAEPQTITGSAIATWTASPRLDVDLESKWLNIDWLAGAGQETAPFAKLKQLAIGLVQSVAGDSTAAAKIDFEQVKIGGENAGGLSIDADRQGNVTHLKTFKISLPGGSRLDLAGDLKNNAGKFSFSGNAFVGGSSFGRLKTWSEKSGVPIDINADGPYSAAGKLEIDDTKFALTDASGDISGRPLAGEFKILHGDRDRTDLTLQAADLDTREVFPKIAAALGVEFRKSLGLPQQTGDEDPKAALPGDVRLRVIAGRLTNGADTYRDVDVSFAIEGKQVKLPVAKLTTENGLSIGLEGRVEQRDSGPVGTLAYDVVGGTPDAMRDLVRKAGLIDVVGDDRFQGLKDGKIAGLIRLGVRTPAATDVTFDGTLNGAHLSGTAEFDGGLNGWRSSASRVQTSLDAPSLPVLLATLGRSGLDAGQPAQPARGSLVSFGTIATGSQSRAEISSQNFNMSFDGNARWPAEAKLALDGRVEVKAARSSDALAVAGISLPSGADDIAAQGTLDIGRGNGAWTIASRNFSFGGSTLAGNVTATADGGALRINGNVTADRVTVPGLLAAVTDARSATPAPPTPNADSKNNNSANDASATAEVRPIWPEGLFNFAALDNASGTLGVSFKSLELSSGVAAHDGKMTLTLASGKLAASDLSAIAAGGQLRGTLSLEKAPNGVALATALTLDQAKLSSLSAAGKGAATIDLHAEARAQSPAGLVAVMTGSGTAKLTGAEVSGPSTVTVAEVVDDVLTGQMQNDPKAIAAGLVAALNTSTMPIGDREFPITLADGSIKLDKIVLEGPDGRIDGTAAADLTTLDMDASFQLTSLVRPIAPPAVPLPNRAPPAAKALPPAVVLYNGELGNLAGVTVNADVADLQRELVVRAMERNVEELEQSRRVDEERARLEKERKKKAAADRAAAIAATKKTEPEQLPPVIPESAGTAKPAPGVPDDSWSAEAFGPLNPPAQQPAAPDATKPESGTSGNTVLTPKISIEPIPPVGAGSAQPDGANSPVVLIDPQTGLPVPKPTPATRPATAQSAQRPPEHRRTSSDEVMKTLGGFQ